MNAERKAVLKSRVDNINTEYRVGNPRKAFDALCVIVAELINEAPTPATYQPQQSQPIVEDEPEPAELLYPIHNHLSTEPCTEKCPNYRENKLADDNRQIPQSQQDVNDHTYPNPPEPAPKNSKKRFVAPPPTEEEGVFYG